MADSLPTDSIQVLDSGLVYRNPKPHLRAVNAWHPSIVLLGDGALLATFDLGQGPESMDYRTYLAHSADEGQTWSEPVRLFQDPVARPATHTVRTARMSDGTLVGFGARFFRDDPEEGLVNRDNLGFCPMELILLRSADGGATWGVPETISPPLVGPAFEVCHRVVELADGRWLAPASTWRGWDGSAPNGMKAIALVSHDRGRTWPEYVDIMDDYANGVIHWEQSVEQLPDGRLLAVAWAYNLKTDRSEATPYAISEDGRTFSGRMFTGFRGETTKMISLGDGRILCLYRNQEKPGLWAHLARIEGDGWVVLAEEPAWQGAFSKMGASGLSTSSDELSNLKFGYPSMTRLPSGDVFGVFWCFEDGIYNIRWVRIRL